MEGVTLSSSIPEGPGGELWLGASSASFPEGSSLDTGGPGAKKHCPHGGNFPRKDGSSSPSALSHYRLHCLGKNGLHCPGSIGLYCPGSFGLRCPGSFGLCWSCLSHHHHLWLYSLNHGLRCPGHGLHCPNFGFQSYPACVRLWLTLGCHVTSLGWMPLACWLLTRVRVMESLTICPGVLRSVIVRPVWLG